MNFENTIMNMYPVIFIGTILLLLVVVLMYLSSVIKPLTSENFLPINYYEGYDGQEYRTENFYVPDVSQNQNETKKLMVFYNPDCHFCKKLFASKEWEDVKSKGISIDMLNCGENPSVAKKYNITGVPTIMMQVNDKLITFNGSNLPLFVDTNGQSDN